MTECCKNCISCHELKHNFTVGKGYETSLACDALHDLIVETTEDDMCEMFVAKEQEDGNRKAENHSRKSIGI